MVANSLKYITVQYRHEPYLPPQVRIVRHYAGRGHRPDHFATVRSVGDSPDAWVQSVCARLADEGVPVRTLPHHVTVY